MSGFPAEEDSDKGVFFSFMSSGKVNLAQESHVGDEGTALEILGVTVLNGDSNLSGVICSHSMAKYPGRQLAWAWLVSWW